MPELPEVEAARRAVEEHCVFKKIVKSTIANDSKVIEGVSPKDFEASLLGKTIVAAHRKGKNMWLQLDSPPFPTFQFGMAGAIYIKGVAITRYKRAAVNDNDEWPSKYSKFFVELSDGLELSFTDKRRFAKVRLLDNPVSVHPISELGPDALQEPMSVDEFYNSLRKKNIGIKAILLDQSFISGIGNWMADEVLYQAKIHPQQIASSLSKECCHTLLRCISEVIEKAVEVGADSSQFPSNWIFHNREKKPGKALIDGKKIEFINAGGRTTAYVPELQKLIGNQADRMANKTGKSVSIKNENSNDDLNEPGGNREEKEAMTGKRSTAVKKPIAQRKKRAGKNNRNENNDNDSDNLEETGESKESGAQTKFAKSSNMMRTRGKKTPAKRKESESETDDVIDDHDDTEEEVRNIEQRRTEMAKTSEDHVKPRLKGKQVKKKAK